MIRTAVYSFFILGCLLLFQQCQPGSPSGENLAADGLPETIDFNFHIKPLLSDRCFKCHGPDEKQLQAGLRLHTAEGAYAELPESPGTYAIVPGKPGESQLLKRITAQDPQMLMPPPDSHLPPFTEREARLIEKWIAQGAEYKAHWAFLPPEKTKLPAVSQKEWPANEIDYFILHQLEQNGLSPSAPAGGYKLVRRLYLHLTGLPPSPEQVEAFVNDGSPQAYEKMVDQLLSSPAYAERMAQHWMDVARYADSHGYQDDSYRSMWPWRDWVIHAFKENMPYDQFLTWQLAGDLLPEATKEQILATGFNRNHPITQEGGVIDAEYRDHYVTDRTNTLGKGILGLTLECAKCHDHKYDPISQKEYFSLYAYFNKVSEKGLQMDAVQAARQEYYADAPYITVSDEDIAGILSFINKTDTVDVNVMVMNDSMPRPTFVLERGQYDHPGEEVEASTPAILSRFSESAAEGRLELARWLTHPEHPLTARVMVNRVWAMIFGAGIVETVEDFGNQGALPSHPELLDWLAVDFVENGWDIHYLLKKIVTSATYRQSSAVSPELLEQDPENRLLARAPRNRLQGEFIRDYILATSGLLNPTVGGPSVKPYQPPGLWEETTAGLGRGILGSYEQDSGEKLYRRSLYTFWKRTLPPPSMAIFDAPTRDYCEVRRQNTNTPLQALALQNDVQLLEAARVLGQRIAGEFEDPEAGLEALFFRIVLRPPSEKEMDHLKSYFKESINYFTEAPQRADTLLKTGQYQQKATASAPEQSAAFMLVAQLLYNLDETITNG